MYRVHKACKIAATIRSLRDLREAIVQAHASKLIQNFQVHTSRGMCSLRGAPGFALWLLSGCLSLGTFYVRRPQQYHIFSAYNMYFELLASTWAKHMLKNPKLLMIRATKINGYNRQSGTMLETLGEAS